VNELQELFDRINKSIQGGNKWNYYN
jgi:hypothetical protein